ncbi:MAG TPA: cytochrome c biogenesis protein CcdA [Syntrophomonadaceae bacterium]|nr:cytochrome c biogenesis protein CcdA [Syntrophomonadaceae bacterium]
MEAWFNQVVPNFLASFSVYGYILVFVAGIITSITPCNVSMIPIIIGHVGGMKAGKTEGFLLSLFFSLGTATTFMILGLIIAAVGGIFGVAQSVIYYFVAFICVLIGLNLMGVFTLNFSYGDGLLNRLGKQEGYGGSFILGLVMGLAGSQCGTPIMFAILSIALASGQIIYGATLLFVYALGRAVPIIAIGTFTGIIKRMDLFAKSSLVLDKVAGIMILMVGLYFAWIA